MNQKQKRQINIMIMIEKYNFIALVFFLIALTSCSHEPEKLNNLSNADALYRLGETMKTSGDSSSALKLYRQALAIDPDYQDANLRIVDILKLDGKFEECRSILDNLLIKNPGDEKVLNSLGKVSIAQNDGSSCLTTYKTLVKSHPDSCNFLNSLAICHDILTQHNQAQSLYLKAIQLAPDNLNIQSNYGLSLALSGRTSDAINLLSKLQQRSQSTLNIKHNLAVAYGLAGQTDKSKQLFESDLEPTALAQNIKILSNLNASKKPLQRPNSNKRPNSKASSNKARKISTKNTL